MKTGFAAALILLTTLSLNAETLVYEGTDGIGKGKHIVFVANDHEYRSEQTCPAMARILARHHGFRCTVLFGIDEQGSIKAGNAAIPGMGALRDADLLFFFTRFMNLPDDQVDLLADYFERGGPAVGIRTSTHCFNGQKGKWEKLNFNYQGDDYRGGLGEQVFGNTWHSERGQSHYGANHRMGCRITPVTSAVGHPILAGVKQIHAYSGAYKSRPPADSTPLVEVQVLNTFEPSDDINAGKPVVSAGWTRDSYTAPSGEKKDARIVYVSFGASEDLKSEDARRCLTNACLWATGLEDQITADLDVSLVGGFAPSPFTTGVFYYEDVKPGQLAGWDTPLMPPGAKLGGITDPKMYRKVINATANRPELKSQLAQQQPRSLRPGCKGPAGTEEAAEVKEDSPESAD